MRNVALALLAIAGLAAAQGDGTTPLHHAAYRDDVPGAAALIRSGANVNAANDLGATPLWLASLNGSAPMVRTLLQAGANPNLALLAGETPLMIAARTGSAPVVELLASKGANVNARAARGQTALMWAVAQKHAAVVAVLLAHGADVHARSDVWSQMMAVPPHGRLEYNRMIPHGGDTALLFAARVGDLASARLLVDAGANVDDADAWHVSAVALAAHAGFPDVVEFLLDKGASPDSPDADFAALHVAVMRRDARMAAALLTHGADANVRLRNWTPTRRSSNDFHFPQHLVGATPLWLAARFSHPEIMRLLVKHGADPRFVHKAEYWADGLTSARRSEATTVLMAAAGMGAAGAPAWVPLTREERDALMLESVKAAVDAGADVDARNADGKTALDGARAARLEPVVQFLAERSSLSERSR
jgi:ankyrin repeat protein